MRDFHRSHSVMIKRDNANSELHQDILDGLPNASKDEFDAKALKEFGQHVHWKVESEHDIDDLMKELE